MTRGTTTADGAVMSRRLFRAGLAVAVFVVLPLTACKTDPFLEKDIQIADVTARRDGDRVTLNVLVKNLGDGSGTKRESKEFCVTARWGTPARLIASDTRCKTKTLWRDHVEELTLVGFPIPTAERIEIHVSMTEEDCKECFQDADDGEWVVLSP